MPIQTTTMSSVSHCYDSYYECTDANPCYEKEVCLHGCCVNATCPGPEYYCFSNGEYQCYEDEHCGKESGCCEKSPVTTTPPPSFHHEPSHGMAHNNAHMPTQNMGHAGSRNAGHAPHQNAGHAPRQNVGHAPHQNVGHAQSPNMGHAPPQNTGHAPAGQRNCAEYYYCSSIGDCWEKETCYNGCCVSTP